MESLPLFRIGKRETRHLLVRASKEQQSGRWRVSTFNDLPTAMLFRPNDEHEGSLHYMFFPSPAGQLFHYHPAARYLLLIGDIDIHIDYSFAEENEDPSLSAQHLLIPSHTFTAVRFRPRLWHRFETKDNQGLGVLAFSFHGNDHVDDLSTVSDDLMEEVTIFWRG
jgi:hypothetical protein